MFTVQLDSDSALNYYVVNLYWVKNKIICTNIKNTYRIGRDNFHFAFISLSSYYMSFIDPLREIEILL